MNRDKKYQPPNRGKHFRNEAGYSLKQVAFLLDIKNFGRISEWENGISNPSLENAIGLAIIYQRFESQIYYELRKKIAQKIEHRRKLLTDSKGQQLGADTGG